MSNQLVAEAAT